MMNLFQSDFYYFQKIAICKNHQIIQIPLPLSREDPPIELVSEDLLAPKELTSMEEGLSGVEVVTPTKPGLSVIDL